MTASRQQHRAWEEGHAADAWFSRNLSILNENYPNSQPVTDIEQVLREKKSFTLRCMLDAIKTLQGRVVTWNRFASSVSIT